MECWEPSQHSLNVIESGAEESIWAQQKGSKGRQEKIGILRVSVLLAPYEIQEDKVGGVCVLLVGERRNVYSVLVGQTEGKNCLRKPTCRWEDNIEMYQPFKYEAQTALFKDPVRTAQ